MRQGKLIFLNKHDLQTPKALKNTVWHIIKTPIRSNGQNINRFKELQNMKPLIYSPKH